MADKKRSQAKITKSQSTTKKSTPLKSAKAKTTKPLKTTSKKVTKPKSKSPAKPHKKPSVKRPKLNKKLTKLDRLTNIIVKHANYLAIGSVVVLLATTILWSILGARIQQGNADQLVNPLLFQNNNVFRDAQIPGQHSFILKWPIFFIISLFNNTSSALIAITVSVVVVTVMALVWIIYRIERRPLYFAAICLALASVLLLIPPQPYAGGILPVNMAMLASRNIEYILYIVSLIALIKANKITSRWLWAGIAGLTLLIASDKIFATMLIGGSILASIVYTAFRKRQYAITATSGIIIGTLSTLVATVILWFINYLGIVIILNQAAASPYAIVYNLHKVALGFVYSISALLTNIGANPAYDATKLRDTPRFAIDRLLSWSGLGYIVNGLILIVGVLAVGYILAHSLAKTKPKAVPDDRPFKLVIMLAWSSFVTFGAFIFTNHEYSVDARYLSIVLPTLFIAMAVYGRKLKLQPRLLIATMGVLLLAIASGIYGTTNIYHQDTQAMANINARNLTVAQAVKRNHISLLVGDYWRVIPIRAQSNQSLTTIPLNTCTQPRNVLSSLAWQKNLATTSFAYLWSYDRGLTDYPQCGLQTIVDSFGKPNKSVTITGTVEKPTESLLFYEGGIHKDSIANSLRNTKTVTVVPGKISEYPPPICKSGHTIMNIVAHEDDDLLFMNPDLQTAISQGTCVRTVFLTAGDSGSGSFYWLSREQGSQAAYNLMDGPTKDQWVSRIVKIAENQYITIETPRNNPSISLIYMHLPDGNLFGQGFKDNNYESLLKLETGAIPEVHSVDKQSHYSDQDVTNTLTTLMAYFNPEQINTQADDSSHDFPDHSDHVAAGNYATRAATLYGGGTINVPIKYYDGYPVRDLGPNLTDAEIANKQAIVFAYAAYDGAVCGSIESCSHVYAYSAFMARQYQSNR